MDPESVGAAALRRSLIRAQQLFLIWRRVTSQMRSSSMHREIRCALLLRSVMHMAGLTVARDCGSITLLMIGCSRLTRANLMRKLIVAARSQRIVALSACCVAQQNQLLCLR